MQKILEICLIECSWKCQGLCPTLRQDAWSFLPKGPGCAKKHYDDTKCSESLHRSVFIAQDAFNHDKGQGQKSAISGRRLHWIFLPKFSASTGNNLWNSLVFSNGKLLPVLIFLQVLHPDAPAPAVVKNQPPILVTLEPLQEGPLEVTFESLFQGPLNGGGFKRGGFPIWTSPSLFVLFCPFWDFPDFFGIFPICAGTLRGFSRFVQFPLCRPINSAYEEQSRKGPRHNLDLSRKNGKPAGLETPPV